MGLEKNEKICILFGCAWHRYRTEDEAGVPDNRSIRNREIENANVREPKQ